MKGLVKNIAISTGLIGGALIAGCQSNHTGKQDILGDAVDFVFEVVGVVAKPVESFAGTFENRDSKNYSLHGIPDFYSESRKLGHLNTGQAVQWYSGFPSK